MIRREQNDAVIITSNIVDSVGLCNLDSSISICKAWLVISCPQLIPVEVATVLAKPSPVNPITAILSLTTDQSVSLNLAFPSIATPKWINSVTMEAWKQGIKTLYYMRTESVLRGDIATRAVDPDCVACDG